MATTRKSAAASAPEAVEAAVKNGTETAAKNYERAVAFTKDNIEKAGTMAYKNYDEAADFSRDTLDAFVASSNVFARGFEEISRHFAGYPQAVMEGNAAHAKRLFGAGFLRISENDQDAVLADFEAGRVPDFSRAPEFFETLRSHTMAGVLGEPAYGGNRGMVGWRLVGFPGHQFGYADPYINRRVDIEPVTVDRPYTNEEEWRAKSR